MEPCLAVQNLPEEPSNPVKTDTHAWVNSTILRGWFSLGRAFSQSSIEHVSVEKEIN